MARFHLSLQHRGILYPVALARNEMDTASGLTKIRDTLKLKPHTQITMLGRTAAGKDERIWFSTIIESVEDLRDFVVHYKGSTIECKRVKPVKRVQPQVSDN